MDQGLVRNSNKLCNELVKVTLKARTNLATLLGEHKAVVKVLHGSSPFFLDAALLFPSLLTSPVA